MRQAASEEAGREAWLPFVRAVLRCYRQPEDAVFRMAHYHTAKGQNALLAKLANAPDYFGEQNPLADPTQPMRQPWEMSDLKQAAALLPLLAKAAFEVETPDPALVLNDGINAAAGCDGRLVSSAGAGAVLKPVFGN